MGLSLEDIKEQQNQTGQGFAAKFNRGDKANPKSEQSAPEAENSSAFTHSEILNLQLAKALDMQEITVNSLLDLANQQAQQLATVIASYPALLEQLTCQHLTQMMEPDMGKSQAAIVPLPASNSAFVRFQSMFRGAQAAIAASPALTNLQTLTATPLPSVSEN
jgi:hypothetical protein